MMPYDTYRLYQIERANSSTEIRRADEQAALFASAVSSLFRGITRPVRAGRRLYGRCARRISPGMDGGPCDRMIEGARGICWPVALQR
jgi:hypothetical protein